MSSVESLGLLVSERLTAAAQEIFGLFKQTIVQYEEEIQRQRRLLHIAWKPEVKLHKIELPRLHVCNEEEDLTEQQLCAQETNSGLEQEEPEPPQIKEEQEKLCSSQQGEHLELKLETETFMLTPTDEQSHHSKPESESNHQLLSNNSCVAESQDQKGGKYEDSTGATGDAKTKPKKRDHQSKRHGNNGCSVNLSESQTSKNPVKCDTRKQMQCHTNEKPYSCEICGKNYRYKSDVTVHMRVHTGEKPFACPTCGKQFGYQHVLRDHIKLHTGEKPYSCEICGRKFIRKPQVKIHLRSHTGERPYSCHICRKDFQYQSHFRSHMRTHTGEKPFVCSTCGKAFCRGSHLKVPMRMHTGERPFLCKICGKGFAVMSVLNRHMMVHKSTV